MFTFLCYSSAVEIKIESRIDIYIYDDDCIIFHQPAAETEVGLARRKVSKSSLYWQMFLFCFPILKTHVLWVLKSAGVEKVPVLLDSVDPHESADQFKSQND